MAVGRDRTVFHGYCSSANDLRWLISDSAGPVKRVSPVACGPWLRPTRTITLSVSALPEFWRSGSPTPNGCPVRPRWGKLPLISDRARTCGSGCHGSRPRLPSPEKHCHKAIFNAHLLRLPPSSFACFAHRSASRRSPSQATATRTCSRHRRVIACGTGSPAVSPNLSMPTPKTADLSKVRKFLRWTWSPTSRCAIGGIRGIDEVAPECQITQRALRCQCDYRKPRGAHIRNSAPFRAGQFLVRR